MRNFLERYPNSGYSVAKNPDGGLSVTCPMHGVFEVSELNFWHFRGCKACRGVHPRAYPAGSPRKWKGSPVFIRYEGANLVASAEGGESFVYAVGYADKRVAKVVSSFVNNLLRGGGFADARTFMDRSFPFVPKRGEYVKRALLEFLGEPIAPRVDAQAIADDKYPDGGYVVSQSDYKGAKADITVTCPEHGPFVTPWRTFTHIKGCPQCNGKYHRSHPISAAKRKIVFILKLCDGYYTVGSDRDSPSKAVLAVSLGNHRDAAATREKLLSLCSVPGVLNEDEFTAAKQILFDMAPPPPEPNWEKIL